MRFEFVDEVDEDGGVSAVVLHDKVSGEVLARVTVTYVNEVTLRREDNGHTKTFSVTSTSQILDGLHINDLLEFLGKSSSDLLLPSDESH